MIDNKTWLKCSVISGGNQDRQQGTRWDSSDRGQD